MDYNPVFTNESSYAWQTQLCPHLFGRVVSLTLLLSIHVFMISSCAGGVGLAGIRAAAAAMAGDGEGL